MEKPEGKRVKRLVRVKKPKAQKLQRLAKITLQDQAYAQIKEALIGGHFTPGDLLVFRSLAAELGTSIMPVRDALMRLVAERALVLLPNRSVQVPPLTRLAFEEITAIRIRLESLAAERAATRASPALIATLTRENAAMIGAIKRRNAEGVLEANKAFHFAIYEAAESEVLLAYIQSLWLRIGPLLRTPWRFYDTNTFFDRAQDMHVHIIEAVKAGNPGRAGTALAEDISAAAEWYRQYGSSLFAAEADSGNPLTG